MKSDSELNLESRTYASSQATPNGDCIDVHHHILPPEYINALAGLGITRSIGVSFPTWSVQDDLELIVIVGTDYPFAGSAVPTQCLKAVRTSEGISN